MKHILDSLDTATNLTARRLTAGIRRTALRNGWDSDVARSISVGYSDGQFKVNIPEEYKEQAMNFEYGTEIRRPTSVIRKFKYGNSESSTFFDSLSKVSKHK